MGFGSVRPALSFGAHMVIRFVLPQRVLHRDGVPLHHLQHPARDVHLHLSLPPAEEGKVLSGHLSTSTSPVLRVWTCFSLLFSEYPLLLLD